MRRTMVALAGSMTASWFAVWTATITQREPGSYCVSRLSVELDLRYNRVGPCIDHKVPPPRFVRDEDPPLLWRIRDPVREPRPRDARHDPECGIVHDYDGVGPRCGGIRPVFGRRGQYAGHRGKPVQIPDDSSGAYVEDDELPGAHM